MLFFFLATRIPSAKLKKWVNILVIVAAATYVVYPFIVNRLVMYFAIWWIGVLFADIYLKKETYSIKSIMPYAYVLFAITAILGLNLYIHYNYTKIYTYPLVAYPFIELRHFVFAIMVMSVPLSGKT